MTINTDTTTGYAFGYIAANDMDGDIVDMLLQGSQVDNISQRHAELEETQRQLKEFEALLEQVQDIPSVAHLAETLRESFEADLEGFEPQIEEPIVEGVYEGVTYRSSWMGGALNFWIFASPLITTRGRRASPCVPNACILHPSRDGDVHGYDVPPGWYAASDEHQDFASWGEEDATH